MSVSQKESSHDSCRRKVCATCGKKVKIDNYGRSIVTDKISALIRKFADPDYSDSNQKYPLGICGTCRLTLVEYGKGITTRPSVKNIMPKYEDFVDRRLTRASSNIEVPCSCFICSTAKSKIHTKPVIGRGQVRSFNNKLVIGNKNLPSNNTGKVSSKTSIKKICASCFQEVGVGKRHPCMDACDSKKKVQANVLNLLEKLPTPQQDKVVTTVLKKRAVSQQISCNSEIRLNGGSKPTRVAINPKERKNVHFTAETLDDYQVKTGASGRNMTRLTNFIRKTAGRNSVPADYRTHCSETGKILETFYSEGIFEFDVGSGKSAKQESRPVVYARASDLLEAVIKERNLQGNYSVKVMADGGQGFFKVCFSILPEFLCENDDLSEPVIKKRRTYSEVGISEDRKWTSVHKLILLCLVPDIPEKYANIKILFDLININEISFKFVADFKLILIINGQQTATATYPCPYCHITLQELRDHDSNSDGNIDESIEPTCSYTNKLKTYGDLTNNYTAFNLNGEKKKSANKFGSTINHPLLSENDDLFIIKKCIVPELHLLQGFVNHLFWNGLVPLIGAEKALLWPMKLKVISKNYHGNIFEGNACRKLLTEADKLNDESIFRDVGYFRIVPFISAFKAMDKLVSCCFSSRKVGPDLDKCIGEVQKCFEALHIFNVSKTLKIHIILDHLKDCLQFLEGEGLGQWSEQAGESVHREFLTFWNRYRINVISDSSYSGRLKKAVVDFSSKHI